MYTLLLLRLSARCDDVQVSALKQSRTTERELRQEYDQLNHDHKATQLKCSEFEARANTAASTSLL